MIKRLLLVLVLAAAAALAVWFGMRSGSPKISSTTVTSLLPNETVAVFHVPDVRDARAQWHGSELYKLWREPEVQAFLQKPLVANGGGAAAAEKLQQLDALGMRDVFVALLESDNNVQRFVGGFRFEGSRDEVEKAIGQWRSRSGANASDQTHETVAHQDHQIEVVTDGALKVATCYDRDWFFAANDLSAMQALLDRADGRVADAGSTLVADENFTAAMKHMPKRYVAFGYARLDRYFDKLMAISEDGGVKSRLEFLRHIRSAAAALEFQDGKLRDVLFVGMPKVPDQGDLRRSSLTLTTADSFLYLATFLDIPDAIDPSVSGITAGDWKRAFGGELGVVSDWAANARLPSIFLTLPVKDGAKARQLIRAVTVGSGADETRWALSDKGGVQYAVQAPTSPMLPAAATVAVSDQLLIAGSEPFVVESAMARSASVAGQLTSAPLFKTAERAVPAAKSAFVYLDAALLYTRLDAAIRPMLVMAAAFVPALVDAIDISKLPAAETITRHLSPVVLSQFYETDGYRTESVGPVPFLGVAAAMLVAGRAGTEFYRRNFPSTGASPALPGLIPKVPSLPPPSPSPSPPEP